MMYSLFLFFDIGYKCGTTFPYRGYFSEYRNFSAGARF